MTGIVGRDDERASINALLERGREGFAAAIVYGPAGIGKTTIWLECVDRAHELGFRVLSCRPAEAEARLAHVSLADLFLPVEDSVLARLPGPQRHALGVALLREDPGRQPPQPRAVGAAVLSTLERLSALSPLLVAIDDAQWLDRESASALAFALRRLEGHSVAVLVAERLVDGRLLDVLELSHDRVGETQTLLVERISLSALYHIIKSRLGIAFARPTLKRIEAASAGNPLYALELARALNDTAERPAAGEPLRVPSQLADLLAARLARLPRETHDALLALACASAPTEDLFTRLGFDDAFAPAIADGIVETTDSMVSFAHPLLAEVVIARAPQSDLRETHGCLASAVENVEERARHLALAAAGPEASTAHALEDAAREASARAAPETAAELFELACQLTPPDDVSSLERRSLELARTLHRAGDTAEARRRLDDLLTGCAAGRTRARALELLAQLEWVDGTSKRAVGCCEEALEHTNGDRELEARILVTLGRVSLDSRRELSCARTAIAVLDDIASPDLALVSEALTSYAGSVYALEGRLAWDLIERGIELEKVAPPFNVGDRMSASLGTWLKTKGDLEGARYWLERTLETALAEGDEASVPYAVSHLPQLELWAGNWARSEERALEHLDVAVRTSQSDERLTALSSLALVHAHVGRLDEARAIVDDALPEARSGDRWNVYQLLSARGLIDFFADRPSDAVGALREALEIHGETDWGDTPHAYVIYAESLIATGDLDRATEVVDFHEHRARQRRREPAIAEALRARALLAAARGDLDAATAAIEETLELHSRHAFPFDLARALVAEGQLLRRAGARRAARESLERGEAIFEELGAPLFAARAREELARIPSRRSSGTELTPSEERVAGLVARGMTNQEVAQALFVSTKTVEANLTRIYRKLEVRSRSALIARLARSETGGEPAKL